MARVLCVTLSIEWQCEQLAWANALPAIALGSALHGVTAVNALKAMTTDDISVPLNRCMQTAMKPISQNPGHHWVVDGSEGGDWTAYARAPVAPWELKGAEVEMRDAVRFHIR
jgi:hypothetical protein